MVTQADIGQRVRDGAGRVGVLREVDPAWEDPAESPGECRGYGVPLARGRGS
ncbi:hypothetical protein M2271_007882 [Streptomyces sp. LBL]|nr:hypothetical protein [Streptomyces sp. LBL]